MNVAVLFYGKLRWFDIFNTTFTNNFLPALSGHNVHYFANFWEDKPPQDYKGLTTSIEKLESFKQIYNPNTITTTDHISIQEVRSFFSNAINKISDNLPNQIYSLNNTLSILDRYQKDNNMSFDLYIKMRTDLAFLSKIKIDNFDNESIYICNSKRPLTEYATDLLLFTRKYDNIKKVCKMGFHFDLILQRLESKENRGLFYHEEVLADYLVHENIAIKSHDFIIDLARHYK